MLKVRIFSEEMRLFWPSLEKAKESLESKVNEFISGMDESNVVSVEYSVGTGYGYSVFTVLVLYKE